MNLLLYWPAMPDESFDWVKARHQCSIRNVFVKLRTEARRNVERRNEQLGQERFNFHHDEENEPNSFSVDGPLQGPAALGESVLFLVRHDHINISRNTEELLNISTQYEDQTGECRLVDGDGDRISRWRVLQRVLAPLLFRETT